jgi:hypothetical protein
MATQEPEQDNTLSKVARSVGSALGAVALKVSGLVGDKSEEPEDKSAHTASDKADSKASDRTDSKSSDKPERKPAKSARSSESSTKTSAPAKKAGGRTAGKGKSRSQEVKKIKRDKHRRKMGRKTRG